MIIRFNAVHSIFDERFHSIMRRKIGIKEIEDMALGATVLGAGGGGDPYVGKLMAIEAIKTARWSSSRPTKFLTTPWCACPR